MRSTEFGRERRKKRGRERAGDSSSLKMCFRKQKRVKKGEREREIEEGGKMKIEYKRGRE